MGYFPLFYEIGDWSCLVIGSGAVACRRAEQLLEAGASVTMYSREKPGEWDHWENCLCRDGKDPAEDSEQVSKGWSADAQGRLSWVQQDLDLSQLQEVLMGYSLVIAATDQLELNTAVAAFCQKRGIPVNLASGDAKGAFLFPSVVREGESVVGICCSGQPVLAREIRERVRKTLPPRLAEWECRLRKKREESKALSPEKRADYMKQALEELKHEAGREEHGSAMDFSGQASPDWNTQE